MCVFAGRELCECLRSLTVLPPLNYSQGCWLASLPEANREGAAGTLSPPTHPPLPCPGVPGCGRAAPRERPRGRGAGCWARCRGPHRPGRPAGGNGGCACGPLRCCHRRAYPTAAVDAGSGQRTWAWGKAFAQEGAPPRARLSLEGVGHGAQVEGVLLCHTHAIPGNQSVRCSHHKLWLGASSPPLHPFRHKQSVQPYVSRPNSGNGVLRRGESGLGFSSNRLGAGAELELRRSAGCTATHFWGFCGPQVLSCHWPRAPRTPAPPGHGKAALKPCKSKPWISLRGLVGGWGVG